MKNTVKLAIERLERYAADSQTPMDLYAGIRDVCKMLRQSIAEPSKSVATPKGVVVIRTPTSREKLIITRTLGGTGYTCLTNLGDPIARSAGIRDLVRWVHMFNNECSHAYDLADLEKP